MSCTSYILDELKTQKLRNRSAQAEFYVGTRCKLYHSWHRHEKKSKRLVSTEFSVKTKQQPIYGNFGAIFI